MKQHLAAWDRSLTARLQGRPVWLFYPMRCITLLGSPVVAIPLAGLMALILRQQDVVWLSNAFAGAAICMVIGIPLIKMFWRRQRPETAYARSIRYSRYSFPSGHALDSVLVYGLLAHYIATTMGTAGHLSVVAAIFLTLAISYSRIYLGAHYVSDVLAGLLLGSSVLVVMFAVIA